MDYLSTFIQMLQTKKFSKNTIRAYVSYMKPYLSYLEKIQISPEQASYQNMRDFLDYIQSERGLSDRTINMIISYLQFFHSARGKKPGEPRRKITLSNEEFIRRFLMHVLPARFQKFRYYGSLITAWKKITCSSSLWFRGINGLKPDILVCRQQNLSKKYGI